MENELNIPSTVNDPHYRYKMPKIQANVQGSGNGMKTNWTNLPDVSNALKVPVEYPLKFIGRELGSNTELRANSYLINGNIDLKKMQELLDKFINKYVLCPKCHLPEIHGKIQVIRKKEIKSTCRSCGAICKLDNAHDFANYIRRNPPPYEAEDNIKVKPQTGEGAVKPKAESQQPITKELKKKIKECCLTLPSILKDDEPIETNIEKIKKFIEKYEFNLDIKFYCFGFGVIPSGVYTKSFEHRLPIIKHFIEKESQNNPEEALFNFIIALQDFIFSRQKGVNQKYMPSLLYYLYDREILTEEFWKDYLSGKIQEKYKSVLISEEGVKKMKEAAKEFSNWIENGPYEGEEDNEKEKEKDNTEKEIKENEKEKAEEEESNKKEKKKGKKKKDKDKKKKEKEKEKEKEVKEEKEKEKEVKEEDTKEKKDEEEDKEEKKEEEEIDIDGI